MSKIDDDIWIMSPNNTNVAEAAHALSNRREKNLKLMAAILQYVYNICEFTFSGCIASVCWLKHGHVGPC